MRFGLIGTGWWARTVHGRALAGSDEVELAGVWGRDPQRTAEAAADLGTRPYEDLDALLGDVDGLSFAVPPDVQARLALRAARAGKHLLLEKPVATSAAAADELAEAAGRAGIASLVFFTARFVPAVRQWLESCEAVDWRVGLGHWFGSAFVPGSRFDTPWRREKGGLWDVGPHALSVLVPALGPVRSVAAAVAGSGDLVHLVLEHAGRGTRPGPTSAVSLSIEESEAGAGSELLLVGPAGRSAMPSGSGASREAAKLALHELLAVASGQRPAHPCDVVFGASVVRVLADAERLLSHATTAPRGAPGA